MDQQEFKFCTNCGAECAVQATRCWICSNDVSKAPLIVEAKVVKTSLNKISETFFMVATLLLLGLGLLIGVGLAQEETGLAIVYAIIVAPALVATVVGPIFRSSKGPVTWASRFMTLLISTAAMIGIVAVLILAALVALLVACFSLFAQH